MSYPTIEPGNGDSRARRRSAVSVAAILIVGLAACSGRTGTQSSEGSTMPVVETTASATAANKAFMQKLFSEKKKLDDFPDRVDPNVIVYEPSSLPFGGTYHGLAELRRIYPTMGQFYDLSRFELVGLYGDEDTVFTSIKVGLAGSKSSIFLAEKFTFRGTKVVEIRVHTCDAE